MRVVDSHADLGDAAVLNPLCQQQFRVFVAPRARRLLRSAPGMRSRRAATSALGGALSQISTGDRTSLEAIQVRPGRLARRRRAGSATSSNPGSKLPKAAYTTMCWRSHSPTSSRASPGAFWLVWPWLRGKVDRRRRPTCLSAGTRNEHAMR
jgi:hypothetical protein